MSENDAAIGQNRSVLLAGLTSLEIKLIAYGTTAAIGAVAYWIIARARVGSAGPQTSIARLESQAQTISGVILAVYGLVLLGLVAIGVLFKAPLWTAAFPLAVGAWGAWWLPASHRRMTSATSGFVAGAPSHVSAFVADLPGQVRWSPGAVSCTPEVAGSKGPRYTWVEKLPDGGQISGTLVQTRLEPGVAVTFQIEGAGASGDYYSFATQGDGTLVTKHSIIEVPYLMALLGGIFIARSEAAAAGQRTAREVQALKTAFESQGTGGTV